MRNTITEVEKMQFLSEIALGISKLVADPKALEKAVKSSYSLSEEESKKLSEAQATIAKADSFMSDIDAKQKALGDINKEREILEADREKFKQREADLLKKENALNIISLNQHAKEVEFTKLVKEIDERSAALDRRESDLVGRAANLTASEKSLQDKAARARQLLAG